MSSQEAGGRRLEGEVWGVTLSYCRKLLAWDLVGAGSGGGDGRGRHNWGMNRYVDMALIYFCYCD